MTALVRWSSARICLEGVEVGFSELASPASRKARLSEQSSPASLQVRVSAVARFGGAGPGAAFVGTEPSASVREPAPFELATH
jgi:hypothetical protein